MKDPPHSQTREQLNTYCTENREGSVTFSWGTFLKMLYAHPYRKHINNYMTCLLFLDKRTTITNYQRYINHHFGRALFNNNIKDLYLFAALGPEQSHQSCVSNNKEADYAAGSSLCVTSQPDVHCNLILLWQPLCCVN